MVANSTATRKAKGRNLQQYVVSKVLEAFPFLKPGDVVSTSMGASGVDIKLSPAAQEVFPVAIECKAQEKLNLWEAWAQCTANSTKEKLNPVLIIKRARQKPLVVVDLDYYLSLHADCDKLGKLVQSIKKSK